MRRVILGAVLVASASPIFALPALSDGTGFDIKGIWTAESRSCKDAQAFVEFDGRDMLGYEAGASKARVAADYSAVTDGERVLLSVTDLHSNAPDQLSFVIEGKDALRLDNSFVARRSGEVGGVEPIKLTRCDTPT